MEKRSLRSLEVSAIGLRCMGLSINYGEPLDTETGVHAIRSAHDLGANFLDTAQTYGSFTGRASTATIEPRPGRLSVCHRH